MKPQKAPQPPTHLEKFRQLRRVMDEIDPARYNQNAWGQRLPCGTFMCIAGYAAHDAWFQAHGWEADWMDSMFLSVLICGEYMSVSSGSDFFGRPMRYLFEASDLGGPSSLDAAKARCDATIAQLEREEVTV